MGVTKTREQIKNPAGNNAISQPSMNGRFGSHADVLAVFRILDPVSPSHLRPRLNCRFCQRRKSKPFPIAEPFIHCVAMQYSLIGLR